MGQYPTDRHEGVPQANADELSNDDAGAELSSTTLVLNGQGISPKASSTSRWKIPAIAENYLNSMNMYVPFMCITETFLKEYISDAQVKIDNYSCFRADRNNRKQGGALVYVHDDLLTSNDFRFERERSFRLEKD